jgi:H+/Cl- antiporter ClcA
MYGACTTTFLGSIESFYLHYKWWDSTLHFYKGILVGFIGIVLYKVFTPRQDRPGISRWILFLFTLSLAVTASVLWEIYEFVGDQFLTHTMQRGGNTDTMLDLLLGALGGLLVAIYSGVKWKKI